MKLLKISLFAFGEGAGEGAAAPASGGNSAGAAQPQTGGSSTAPGQPQGGKAPDAQAQQPSAKPSFEELIRGDYKADYDSRVQAIVAQQVKEKNAELSGLRPIMALLQQRYGVADGEGAAAAVRQALENDEAYWQSAADAAGLTVEQYRQIERAKAESREYKALLDAQLTAQRQAETIRALSAQAEALAAKYPGVDANDELAGNPKFGELVRRGIDMTTAYEVLHREELLARTAAAASQQAEQRTMDAVRRNQARPGENGAGGGQPAKPVFDPSRLTPAQRMDIERRARNGERITFKGGTF